MKRRNDARRDAVGENRQAVAEVLCFCILAALYDKYGVGQTRLERVTEQANAEAEIYAKMTAATGQKKAREKLNESAAPHMGKEFLLPAVKAPKNDRERVILYEQRDAADVIAKAYALAMAKVLKFGPGKIDEVLAEAADSYRQFRREAADGDVYGYELLRRKMEQILHAPVELADEGKGPVFADRMF